MDLLGEAHNTLHRNTLCAWRWAFIYVQHPVCNVTRKVLDSNKVEKCGPQSTELGHRPIAFDSVIQILAPRLIKT